MFAGMKRKNKKPEETIQEPQNNQQIPNFGNNSNTIPNFGGTSANNAPTQPAQESHISEPENQN